MNSFTDYCLLRHLLHLARRAAAVDCSLGICEPNQHLPEKARGRFRLVTPDPFAGVSTYGDCLPGVNIEEIEQQLRDIEFEIHTGGAA